jgi:hypothetical protein
LLFQVPRQDAIIPLPDNLPDENEVADAGGGVLDFLAGYPSMVAAVLVAVILYKMWQNAGMRVLLIVIGVIIITVMVVS